jgi:DNA end-binding protein Ku
MRGKEHLVLIRPYDDVLMLHTMHYADEIRSPTAVDQAAKKPVAAAELKLAERLIDDLSVDTFQADKFEDTYRHRILRVAEQKAAGKKVATPPLPRRAKVIDLMSALKNSLKAREGRDSSQGSGKISDEDPASPKKRGRRNGKSSMRRRRYQARA